MPYEVQSHCSQCHNGDSVMIGNWPDHMGIFVCKRCKALVNIETAVRKCPGCGYEPQKDQYYDHSFAIPYIGGRFMREPEKGPLCPKCGEVPVTFHTNSHINLGMVVSNRPKALACVGKDHMEKAIFLNSMMPVTLEFGLDVSKLLDYFNLDFSTESLITKRVSFPIFIDIRTHIATRLAMEHDAFGCKFSQEEMITRCFGGVDAATQAKATATAKARISPVQEAVKREELAKLQGTWMMVETTALGKTIGEETLSKGPPITLLIEGNTYQDRFKGTFEIDPTNTPKWLDRFPPAEAITGNRKQLCIYQFEGERLRIRLALPNFPERPTDFAPTDSYVTLLYERLTAQISAAKRP